ncbi:MAG: glycosyltransferase [Selenomonadaceae bacterium]|nr:glycosyltransferase [Selenomonadaceae bacterium]
MKISVIIPVFNAENYLRECLESILIQTLTDFEVILVDDCSTDSSFAIAESYLEKFGGRLKIISLPINTGNASEPRNTGLKFSRGEYIFFMDNDDLIVDNALETLYNFAVTYQTDVVYMNQGFLLNGGICAEAFWDKSNLKLDKPKLESESISERIENFLKTGYGWAPWTKFLRRDFLIANKIKFPYVKISEDVLWTFKVICLAKNLLRVPNQLYIYRSAENSWSHVKRTPSDEIKFWLDPLIKGLDYLDDFMNEINFFAQNPNYRFDVTNFFVKMQIAGMLGALKNLNRYELYEIIRREFNGKHAALIANLFVVMNFYRDKFLEVR